MADLDDEDLGGLREIKNDLDEEDFEPPRKSSNKLIIGILSLVVFFGLFLLFKGEEEPPESGPSPSVPSVQDEVADTIVLPREEAFKEMVIEEPPAGDIVIRSDPNAVKSIPPVEDERFSNREVDKRFSNPASEETGLETMEPAPPLAPKKVEAPKPIVPPKLPIDNKTAPKVAMAVPVRYTIQFGAFKAESGAEILVTRLKNAGYNAYIQEKDGGIFRVRVGVYQSRDEALTIADEIRKSQRLDSIVVRR